MPGITVEGQERKYYALLITKPFDGYGLFAIVSSQVPQREQWLDTFAKFEEGAIHEGNLFGGIRCNRLFCAKVPGHGKIFGSLNSDWVKKEVIKKVLVLLKVKSK